MLEIDLGIELLSGQPRRFAGNTEPGEGIVPDVPTLGETRVVSRGGLDKTDDKGAKENRVRMPLRFLSSGSA